MADDRDPRFVPIKVEDGFAIMPDRWTVDFRASMGELSRFFIEVKENARLMGMKCPRCGSVYFWPRSWCHDCYVDTEWVEMSGKGKVTVFAQVDVSLNDIQKEVPFIQGGVHLEGARYATPIGIKNVAFEDLYTGMPVRAEFLPPEERTGRIRDFYFVPDE